MEAENSQVDKRASTMRKISATWRFGLGGWLAAAAVALTLVAGCKHQAAAPTDQQLTSAIQAKIQGDQALAGQNIQVSVANGVATLSGTVANDASRALAGDDSGSVSGVRTVVNNLTVQAPQVAATAPAAEPEHTTENKERAEKERDRSHRDHASTPAPQEQASVTPPSDGANLPPVAPAAQDAAPAPAQPVAPPPPPPPVAKIVALPAGTVLPVTLTESLDSKKAAANDVFHATLASDVMYHGMVAIPRGTPVLGQVVDAKKAGHFKGEALLSIELTQMTLRGRKIGIMTDTYKQEGAEGRGKNTAEKTGGGALFGALVGALAGGGKGAAIGALAGGGAGAGVNAVTRGREVRIPSESRLEFRLQEPLTVKIPPPGSAVSSQDNEPHLVRPQQ